MSPDGILCWHQRVGFLGKIKLLFPGYFASSRVHLSNSLAKASRFCEILNISLTHLLNLKAKKRSYCRGKEEEAEFCYVTNSATSLIYRQLRRALVIHGEPWLCCKDLASTSIIAWAYVIIVKIAASQTGILAHQLQSISGMTSNMKISIN